MKIVGQSEFHSVLTILAGEEILICDTETTGLDVYGGDHLFSLIIGTMTEEYYFNFIEYDEFDGDEEFTLYKEEHFDQGLAYLFETAGKLWVMHNAKYDMSILKNWGVTIAGTVHDTMTAVRLVDSEVHPGSFSLDYQGEQAGVPKDQAVKEWILKNKAYKTVFDEDGSKKLAPQYALVPFRLISKYGCQDVATTRAVYLKQMKALEGRAASMPSHLPNVLAVLGDDRALVETVWRMEQHGVLIDMKFCRDAIEHYKEVISEAEEKFKAITGIDFIVSGKVFSKLFEGEKDKWVYGAPTKKKGEINPKFDASVLSALDHPAARVVLEHKDAKSSIDYYKGFLKSADKLGVIHASFNQHAANTGRFSSSAPNLQNLTKSEGDELLERFVVRRAITPRPGNVLHMIDFNSMEYRVLLEYAARFARNEEGVWRLIKEVLAGKDLHQATADLAGISRPHAKTANFALIYGMGSESLAKKLGVTLATEGRIRKSIFEASPEIEKFLNEAKATARSRGYVVNWAGRCHKITDKADVFKAPNKIIQGGCADIVKKAMNMIDAYLEPFETKMVLTIHDELVFDGPPEEASIVIPEIIDIMENVFPHRHVPMKVSVDHSFTSLADKIKGAYEPKA